MSEVSMSLGVQKHILLLECVIAYGVSNVHVFKFIYKYLCYILICCMRDLL